CGCELVSCSHGMYNAVAVIITMYRSPAHKSEKIISINAFLGEKLNSSAAWGILSNPTNAHGAIATISMMLDIADTSGLKTGCRFSNEVAGLKIAPAPMNNTPQIIKITNMNCNLPDNVAPRMFI